MAKNDYSDTTVIIPTFNEEANILSLIKSIEKSYPKIEIIISDDGSKDSTQEIVKKHHLVNKHEHLFNRKNEPVHGLTISIIDAAKIVKTKNIVVMDGDFQHPPAKINDFVKKLNSGFDLAIGTRNEITEDWAWYRKLMSDVATDLGKVRLFLHGVSVKDPMSGFFAVKTDLFKRVIHDDERKFEFRGYKVLFDLLKYIPKKTLISYVYYDFGMRKGGESKIGMRHVVAYFDSLFK